MTYAFLAHQGQVRKYDNSPYINHPFAVAEIVRTVPHTEEMIIGALLHDVVEDTKVDLDDIEYEFGKQIRFLVFYLTDFLDVDFGNRAQRQAAYRSKLKRTSKEAKTIKIADLIHNSYSIVKYDPKFSKVFIDEMRLLLDESLKGGDADLWGQADLIVKNYYKENLNEN